MKLAIVMQDFTYRGSVFHQGELIPFPSDPLLPFTLFMELPEWPKKHNKKLKNKKKCKSLEKSSKCCR